MYSLKRPLLSRALSFIPILYFLRSSRPIHYSLPPAFVLFVLLSPPTNPPFTSLPPTTLPTLMISSEIFYPIYLITLSLGIAGGHCSRGVWDRPFWLLIFPPSCAHTPQRSICIRSGLRVLEISQLQAMPTALRKLR